MAEQRQDGDGFALVTQVRVEDAQTERFHVALTDAMTSASRSPGFIEQTVIPPTLPAQADWVVMQWFDGHADAVHWLRSDERRTFEHHLSALAATPPSSYLVADRPSNTAGSATAVIATRVQKDREADYRAWQHRVAASAASAPGYEGHRFQPPIPGVQESWTTVLWFGSDGELQRWLGSPERAAILAEAAAFVSDVSVRSVRTGFEQWFDGAPGATPPAAWKMSMMVLLVLYPCVFLIDTFIVPFFTALGVPFWLTLFGANTLTVIVLGVVVPLVSRAFSWWLSPQTPTGPAVRWKGLVAVVGVYLLSLAATAAYTALT